jgi:acyl-coenzyme A synthetase/AMP-(fatty) acid ligase
VPSEKWGQEVAAVLYAPTLTDVEAIVAQSRELLGPYKAPKHVRLSPQPLPRTASNKIARTNLLDLFEQCGSSTATA